VLRLQERVEIVEGVESVGAGEVDGNRIAVS